LRGVKQVVNFEGSTPIADEVIDHQVADRSDGCIRIGEDLKAGDTVVVGMVYKDFMAFSKRN
jgi:hypothetical protein